VSGLSTLLECNIFSAENNKEEQHCLASLTNDIS